jgi:hypothetical protein
MRRIITGLSAVLAGVTLGGCTTKQSPCPADGQTFRVLPLSSSLATGDHANASFDGERVVVAFSQGALGNETASSVWSESVSCGGEVGSPVMVSRSLGTNGQPGETLANDSTWFAWATSPSASTGDTADAGTTTDAGYDDTDGGTPDAGVVTVV